MYLSIKRITFLEIKVTPIAFSLYLILTKLFCCHRAQKMSHDEIKALRIVIFYGHFWQLTLE